MTNLAKTDFSLTVDPTKLGSRRWAHALMSIGNGAKTYPFGGIPMPDMGKFGAKSSISDIQIIDPDNSGIAWKYDRTNHKLKAFVKAPAVVFEEVVTMTAGTTYDTGTTKYPMAWPLYAGNGNVALGLLPAGLNPVTTTVAINMHSATPGTRATITALGTDTYTTVTISYITQAWFEVFGNLVEAEIMAAGATTTNGITFTAGTPDTISFLTAAPFLVGLMVGLKLSTTVSAPKPCFKGETTVAGEYALDWTNTSPAATTMKVVTTANWDAATASIYFNYIKDPGAGSFLHDNFLEEEGLTGSSNVLTAVRKLLLLSTPGFIPGPTVSSTSATWPLGLGTMTIGSLAQWKPGGTTAVKTTTDVPWYEGSYQTTHKFISGSGVGASLATKPSYITGDVASIATVPLEMPDGFALKNRTIRAIVWGK